MSSSHAIARLAVHVTLALFVIGLGCSSPKSQPCESCDAGIADLPIVSIDPEVPPDLEPDAMAVDEASPIDEAAPLPRDASGEAALPLPLPDAGPVLASDFENGKADGWQSTDRNDAGLTDEDWSVIVSDTGSVYSEGILDSVEWHITHAVLTPVADQIVEARMRVVDFYDSTPSYVAALFARFDPVSDSGYFLALRGDGSVIIRKRVQGKSASWASGVAAGIVAGTWHTVRLEIMGDTASAFLDGELVYSVVDSTPLPAGTMALGTYGATVEVDSIFLAQAL